MKFLESYNQITQTLEKKKSILIIFTDPKILTPSQTLVKFFNFNKIAMQLIQNIFIFKNVDMKVYERFNLLQFPQVTVLKDSVDNVVYNFIGCNQQNSTQALSELAVCLGRGKPHRRLNLKKKLCPSEHEMKFINQLNEVQYRNGCFACDQCSMFSHVEVDKPILHCQVCEFDICYACSHEEVMN